MLSSISYHSFSDDIDSIPRPLCKTNPVEAQCIIDKEIAVHEATILELKHRRNMYSPISRLPTEVIAAIFLSLKADFPQLRHVLGVCRQWRDILLATPGVWCSIDLSSTELTLELLKRSRLAPLQVSIRPRPCLYTEQHICVAEAIMVEIGRIQELTISLPPINIVRVLCSNEAASAPILEQLRLAVSSAEPFALPVDILCRDMPSLRHLELHNFNITSKLPPFPHLEYLHISTLGHGIRSSLLLRSLCHCSRLKDIEVRGLVNDIFTDTSWPPVELPKLTRIYIEADFLEAAAIFAHLRYPPNARVIFSNTRIRQEEPDLSGLVEICGHFAKTDALSIDRVLLDGSYYDRLRLTVWSQDDIYLSLKLETEQAHNPMLCTALCSALPFNPYCALEIEGFKKMTQPKWSNLFLRCSQICEINFIAISAEHCIMALMKASVDKPLLPHLQTIRFTTCGLTVVRGGWKFTSLFDALKDLLVERRHLGIPVEGVSIVGCSITAGEVDELRKLTELDWDGEDKKYTSSL